MSYTEKQIQGSLYLRLPASRLCAAPNVYLYDWESDLLSLTKGRAVHEYEIKLTRSDFRADSKKVEKHQVLLRGEYAGEQWGTNPETGRWDKSFKTIKRPRPNYFWYVCPVGMVGVDELPPYAGLMTFEDVGSNWIRFEQVRRAPRLHNGKTDPERIIYLLRKLEFRFWEYRLGKPDTEDEPPNRTESTYHPDLF